MRAAAVRTAVDSGVSAYMVDRVKVKPVIDRAMSTFATYRRLRNEADEYRTQTGFTHRH